jgi:multidrug efflux pump subunit AcrA (membrane-fusion protein)
MPNDLPIDVPQPARVAVWKRRPRGRWVILTGLLALVAGGLLYWRLHPRRLVVVQVVRGTAVEAVYANGTVEAKDRVDIRARAAGPIMSLLVREGDVVEKDQLLALIDTPTLGFEVQRGQADLSAANERATRAPLLAALEAQRQGLQAQLTEAQADLQRQLKLSKEGASTQQRLERAQALVTSLEAQIAANRAQQSDMQIVLRGDAARQRAGVASLQARLKDSEVRSPLSGTVLQKRIEEGEIVAVNQSLLRIGNLDRLWIEAHVDEADIGRVHSGMPAAIELYAFDDRVVWGRVVRILPDGDRERKSFEVDIELDKPLEGLLSGMTAEINIVVNKHDGALLVPANAVRDNHLWISDKNGRLERREVKLGIRDLVNVEVLEGIDEGELVVVPGEQDKLVPGQRVKPLSPPTVASAPSLTKRK